jgi:hypothetical protein
VKRGLAIAFQIGAHPSVHLRRHQLFRTSYSIQVHLDDKGAFYAVGGRIRDIRGQASIRLAEEHIQRIVSTHVDIEKDNPPWAKSKPSCNTICSTDIRKYSLEARRGGKFWPRCRNQAHALNKSAGSACSEQEIDLALATTTG